MSRLKEYDRENVLERAADLFWRKGFEAASMSEMVEATGLNSASMYKEFGSKEALFRSALSHYETTRLSPLLQVLRESPGLQGLDNFLEAAAGRAGSRGYKGCLMLNTLTEKNSVSPAAIQQVETFCAKLKDALQVSIGEARERGEIPPGKDPAALADFIICMIHGMVLYGRANAHKAHIGGIVDTVRATLTR